MQHIIDLLQSRTAWAALFSALAGILAIVGVDIGLTPELTEKVLGGMSALGGLLAIVFRGAATKKVGGGALE